jgi:hypothetical protein
MHSVAMRWRGAAVPSESLEAEEPGFDSAPPKRMVELVRDNADREHLQPGIWWPRDRWERWLPQHRSLFEVLPDLVSREDVRQVAREADDSGVGAERLFVASMVWGFGRVGYGPYRTNRMLASNPAIAEKLQQVRHCLTSRGNIDAYRLMADPSACRLQWLGPAFGTKFLHFASPEDATETALILDRIVASWLREHAGLHFSPLNWRPSVYSRYLTVLHSWARELGVPAERLETLIFLDALEPGSQWSPR